MKALSLLVGALLVASASAEPLRLILVPQKVVISRETPPMKFDLFLYNAGNSPQMVPALEPFRAFWVGRSRTNSDERPGNELRAFSQPIKDHSLKAQRVDHTVIEIDLSSADGDYIELYVQVGHGKRTLTSNSVLLLLPVNAPPVEPASSAKPAVTPSK